MGQQSFRSFATKSEIWAITSELVEEFGLTLYEQLGGNILNPVDVTELTRNPPQTHRSYQLSFSTGRSGSFESWDSGDLRYFNFSWPDEYIDMFQASVISKEAECYAVLKRLRSKFSKRIDKSAKIVVTAKPSIITDMKITYDAAEQVKRGALLITDNLNGIPGPGSFTVAYPNS